MNTGYKLIGKCLSDDHYQNLFNKIEAGTKEHLASSKGKKAKNTVFTNRGQN